MGIFVFRFGPTWAPDLNLVMKILQALEYFFAALILNLFIYFSSDDFMQTSYLSART